MRFITVYLIGYFLLLTGAYVVVRQSGMLGEIPERWVAMGAAIAVGLGLLLAAASRSRTVHAK